MAAHASQPPPGTPDPTHWAPPDMAAVLALGTPEHLPFDARKLDTCNEELRVKVRDRFRAEVTWRFQEQIWAKARAKEGTLEVSYFEGMWVRA
jgi:hypothetical protein